MATVNEKINFPVKPLCKTKYLCIVKKYEGKMPNYQLQIALVGAGIYSPQKNKVYVDFSQSEKYQDVKDWLQRNGYEAVKNGPRDWANEPVIYGKHSDN